MGKASRQRRQKKEQDRQRQRAAQGHGSQPGAGYRHEPGHAPSPRDQVAALITRALDARIDRPDAYTRSLDQLSSDLGSGWTQVVSRTFVEFLRLAVTSAWKHGWQPAELARHVGREASATHVAIAADMI